MCQQHLQLSKHQLFNLYHVFFFKKKGGERKNEERWNELSKFMLEDKNSLKDYLPTGDISGTLAM